MYTFKFALHWIGFSNNSVIIGNIYQKKNIFCDEYLFIYKDECDYFIVFLASLFTKSINK